MKRKTQGLKKAAAADGRAYLAPALEKGLDILETLCLSEKPMTQKDLALHLGRSVSEIYRMLACLVNRKYVTMVSDAGYAISTRLFELAQANPPTHRLLVEATPVMHRLAGELNQSCHLTVYSQGRQIVLAKVDTPGGMGFAVRVGAELDVIVSASGRVLLAFQDEQTRALRIGESLQRQPAHNDPNIAATLNRIRSAGYASMASVQVRGLWAVAFPILDAQGLAIAALTVPYAERIDLRQRKSIPDVIAALGDAARSLSARIGGVVSTPDMGVSATRRRAPRTSPDGVHARSFRRDGAR